MLTAGPAKRVTVYVTERTHYRGQPVYLAVLNYLFYHGVTGATATRGIAGFGAGHRMHTDRIVDLSVELPVKVEFVEEAARLEPLLPKLHEMVTSGLIEIQDTTVLKAPSRDAPGVSPLPAAVLRGKAKMMRIYVGKDDQWHDRPLVHAIVESLRSHDLAGATVYRGILGYGAHRRLHGGQHWLAASRDTPVMIAVIDEESKIRAYLPMLDDMVQEGLVVLSDVDVIKYTHRLAPSAADSAEAAVSGEAADSRDAAGSEAGPGAGEALS
jgi:PII-like signaling protein